MCLLVANREIKKMKRKLGSYWHTCYPCRTLPAEIATQLAEQVFKLTLILRFRRNEFLSKR